MGGTALIAAVNCVCGGGGGVCMWICGYGCGCDCVGEEGSVWVGQP